MIGYDPAAQAIREARGLPYATGADEPRHDWDDQPAFTGASGAGLPGNPMQPSDPAETGLLHMKAAS